MSGNVKVEKFNLSQAEFIGLPTYLINYNMASEHWWSFCEDHPYLILYELGALFMKMTLVALPVLTYKAIDTKPGTSFFRCI